MDEIRSLLKTIRGVGPNKPVTQLQLSEIIRALHRERINLYDEYYTGGLKPIATGKNSVVLGEGAKSTSYREMLVGSFPEELTATPDEWVATDRLFGIGNGIDADNRHDAFRVYKSGYAQLNNSLRLGAYSWGANNPEAGSLQYTAGGSFALYRNTTWNRLAFIDSFAANNQFAYFDSLTETLKTRAIAIADITGLQTELDGKSPVHTHPYLSDSDSRISQWEAAYTARISSLTNVGNSGAATLVGNVLNIPNYTLAGLGGAPASGSVNYVQVSPASAQIGNIWMDGNISISSYARNYNGTGHTTPSQTPAAYYFGMIGGDSAYPTSFGSISGVTLSANGYGYSYQLFKGFGDSDSNYGNDANELWYRSAKDDNTWRSWVKLWHSGNANLPTAPWDASQYKLSGVDLHSSLTANTLQKWDGSKHLSVVNAAGYLSNDGSGNMSFGAIAGFLPLTGGTLTGPLTGTTANFSGVATAASFVFGTTGYSFEVVSGKLVIKYYGTALMSLDSSGNLKVVGDGYGGGL